MQPSPVKRRPLSMTSLIDVIFLLLLFFMLTSTFSKFSEVRLSLGGTGAAQQPAEQSLQMVLIRLTAEGLSMNGSATTLESVPEALSALGAYKDLHALLSVTEGASSQDFVEALHHLGGLKELKLTVIK